MFCDYIERLHHGIEMLRPQLYNWFTWKSRIICLHSQISQRCSPSSEMASWNTPKRLDSNKIMQLFASYMHFADRNLISEKTDFNKSLKIRNQARR